MERRPGDRESRPRLEDDPYAVAERRSRALEEPLDVRLERRAPFAVLEVRNPLHRTDYRVMLPLFPDRSVALCTCTDFARRDLGTCKHVEAAVHWRSSHPESRPVDPPRPSPDAGLVWAEVDLRARDPGDGPTAQRIRAPGRALIDAG